MTCWRVLLIGVFAASCAPRPVFRPTMPNPEGCFVHVWDAVNFAGTYDFINGPRRYESLRDIGGAGPWRNRIRSVETGPTATVTLWSDENARGEMLRMPPGSRQPTLPAALAGRIESMVVECAPTRRP
jgi:hypothetical protein